MERKANPPTAFTAATSIRIRCVVLRAPWEMLKSIFRRATTPPSKASNAASDESDNKNTVHIKTSGLVFNKQTGLASTTERIEFRLAEAAGSATGASFDSQTGIIILTADVAF